MGYAVLFVISFYDFPLAIHNHLISIANFAKIQVIPNGFNILICKKHI